MRIGIISDTHDQMERAELAVQSLASQGATVLFHCGDLVESTMVAICAVMPCYFVFGNNDVDDVPMIKAAIDQTEGAVCLGWGGEVTLAGKRIAMTHGHFPKEVRRLLTSNPDYLFSGHSHVAADWQDGATRRINPALHRASSYSVALLDIEGGRLQFLTIDR